MSAEILRRAAALMRKRAEDTDVERFEDHHWYDPADLPIGTRDAEHIASWHPAVASAVADLLGMQADHAAGRGAACGSCVDYAVTVARAYLGEPS